MAMNKREKKHVMKSIRELQDVLFEIGDVFEDLGILIDDVAQLYFADDRKVFLKEKKDLRQTMKTIKRDIDNATFINFGENRIGNEVERKKRRERKCKCCEGDEK